MMRTYQLVGWWPPQGNGSMGDMLNLGCWQWISMEYHPYGFLEGHICMVGCCSVELAVCILFEIFILTKDLWQLSFRLQCWALLYFTMATIANQARQFVGIFHPIHYHGSIAFVSWEYYDIVIILERFESLSLRFWDLKFRRLWFHSKLHSELSSRTHGVTVIGVGSPSFESNNHLEGAGSILTAGE